MTGFFAARIFTTLYPHTVVVTGGVHFHHFWYGLAMVAVAGWLGIVSVLPVHRRVYALVFGLGGGLIGDEVGLLLTFGNYYSELTYLFGIIVVGGASLCLLLFSHRRKLREDVIELGHGERLFHVGVVIAGLSGLAFAFDALLPGAVTLVVGLSVAIVGWQVHTRRVEPD
jgi:hypothetical protein